MSQSPNDQEPSIEEILASIRQIISDDDDVAPEAKPVEAKPAEAKTASASAPARAAPVKPPPPPPEPPPEPPKPAYAPDEDDEMEDGDVLELIDRIDEEDSRSPISFETAMDGADMVIEAEEEPEALPPPPPSVSPPKSAPKPAPPPEAAPKRAEPDDDNDSLLSAATVARTLEGFSRLAATTPVERPNHAPGITLEDITREMLRPMLREWLDSNLPPLIEKLVQRELDKLSRRASDD